MARSPAGPRTVDPRVGARLRDLRHERGLTIEQVATASGLTKGFISQLERDAASPSLSSLARLCEALDVRLAEIFDEPGDEVGVVRRGERRRAPWNPDHFLLSPPGERRLQAIETVVPPGGGAGDELYTFPGEIEFVYVVRGGLVLTIGEETHVLGEGDAVTYPLRAPHTWRNAAPDAEAVVLWVAAPNPYSH